MQQATKQTRTLSPYSVVSRLALAIAVFFVLVFASSPKALAKQPAINNTSALTVLVVGDSLSAEYGLERGTGWVNLLRKKLKKDHPQSSVINASISGDTSAGGKARLPILLQKHKPTLVILALGSNDALRGLSLTATLKNMVSMGKSSQQSGANVLIAGMQMPPNYGKAYQKQFQQMFAHAAQKSNATLLPFLLKNVADIDAKKSLQLFQHDRIHPNEKAQKHIMENVWEALQTTITNKH